MAAKKDNEPVLDAEALAAENAALKEQLASAESRVVDAAFTPDDAQLVESKIGAGLSREQAIEVVKAQKAHDAALAKK